MTDLEITMACAEAIGYRADADGGFSRLAQGAGMDEPGWFEFIYDPLRDDAQAMALVKKFKLRSMYNSIGGWWTVKEPVHNDGSPTMSVHNADLNRAICECCANMTLSKR